MASKFSELVIDCKDPEVVASFWREVLGYREKGRSKDDDEDEWIELVGDEGPSLLFGKVPDDKVVKNRLHLDLNATDRSQDEEVERVLGLGARRKDIGQGDVSWVVLADPEDNEFCILRSSPYANPGDSGVAT